MAQVTRVELPCGSNEEVDGVVGLEWLEHVQDHRVFDGASIGDGEPPAADLAVAVPFVDRPLTLRRAAVRPFHVGVLLEW